MASATAAAYADFQELNPEREFNADLIGWRERDDVLEYLEDVFSALEVVPGIQFLGARIERDESRFPADLVYNDVEYSRLDLAQVSFRVTFGDESEEIKLSIFLPKLIDGLFYVLNGSIYYPILQLQERGTYVTRKTLTLKTLLMPLMLRRDYFCACQDLGAEGQPERQEMLFMLDLFKYRINCLKYFFAQKGMAGTLEFLGVHEEVCVAPAEDLAGEEPGEYRAYAVANSQGLCVAARAAWVDEDPHYRGSLLATLADALDGIQALRTEAGELALPDTIDVWRRRLGAHFTPNASGQEEKAAKILVSLERVLDRRTKKNLEHVRPEDKDDVYCVLRWMMREFRSLASIDGMDMLQRRIRVSEYLIHPLLLKFSEGTYRLLNTKTLSMGKMKSIFRAFVSEEAEKDPATGKTKTKAKPQTGFLIKRLVANELLRYVNLVNSFDLLTALRFTTRGPQTMGERGRGDIPLRYRGHHPSYVGRIGLSAASASDPGTSGTLVPFAETRGQFFA